MDKLSKQIIDICQPKKDYFISGIWDASIPVEYSISGDEVIIFSIDGREKYDLIYNKQFIDIMKHEARIRDTQKQLEILRAKNNE